MLMKKKMGRPTAPTREYRGQIYAVRLNSRESTLVDRAVQASGLVQSQWMREVLLHAAQAGHGGQRPGSSEGAGGVRR